MTARDAILKQRCSRLGALAVWTPARYRSQANKDGRCRHRIRRMRSNALPVGSAFFPLQCERRGAAIIFGRIAGYSQFRSDQKTRPLAVCIMRSLHNEIEISAEIPYGWVELRKRNANHYSGTSEPADGARSCSAAGVAAPGEGFMAPSAPAAFCA